MSSASRLHLPDHPSDRAIERSRKFELKKDILLWLHDKGLGWTHDKVKSVGNEFVAALTDIIWYIDGHFTTLSGRACPIPQEFETFSGYNNPSKSKHRRRDVENLSAVVLDSHSSLLNSFALQPWLNSTSWTSVRSAVCMLAESLYKYAEYLKQKNIEVQENHGKLVPIRSSNDAECYTFIKKAMWIKPANLAQFKPLQNQLDSKEPFDPVFLNEFAPANRRYL